MNLAEIEVAEYELAENSVLTTYTAKWCGPCRKIKENGLEKYLENTKQNKSYTVSKDFFKANVNNFIPFFKIDKGGRADCIQTSDFAVLKEFLEKERKVIFDENF